jgi:uncharacterized surface protein with fasciclin (FAS1) repeats
MAADVSDGLEAETLQGSTAGFTIDGGTVMIADATIVTTDIETSNGVIHVIDAVILPPAEEEEAMMPDVVDTAVAAGNFETLVTALQAAELVMRSSVRAPSRSLLPPTRPLPICPRARWKLY